MHSIITLGRQHFDVYMTIFGSENLYTFFFIKVKQLKPKEIYFDKRKLQNINRNNQKQTMCLSYVHNDDIYDTLVLYLGWIYVIIKS